MLGYNEFFVRTGKFAFAVLPVLSSFMLGIAGVSAINRYSATNHHSATEYLYLLTHVNVILDKFTNDLAIFGMGLLSYYVSVKLALLAAAESPAQMQSPNENDVALADLRVDIRGGFARLEAGIEDLRRDFDNRH
jgi:hypothetical protein